MGLIGDQGYFVRKTTNQLSRYKYTGNHANMAAVDMNNLQDMQDVVWLSFCVKEGAAVKLKKVCPVNINSTLGTSVSNMLDGGYVKQIMGYQKDPALDTSISGTELDSAVPISTVCHFGFKFINISLATENTSSDSGETSIFDVMMSSSRKYERMPEKLGATNKRNILYNNIICLMEEFQVGFRPCQVHDLGKEIVTTLTGAMWYIDPYIGRLKNRSITLPPCFAALAGMRDLKAQHRKLPELKSSELKDQVNKLGNILMSPWFMVQKFKGFRDAVSSLYEALDKYLKFLEEQNQRTKKVHASAQPVRGLKDHWALEILEPQEVGLTAKYAHLYEELTDMLSNVDEYQAVPLGPFEPENLKDRRVWIDHLKSAFPFACHKWTYYNGNYLGNTCFLWKIPQKPEDRRSDEDIRVMNEVRKSIPLYATRSMRQEFINTYAKTTSPAILRNMFHMLTGYQGAPENAMENDIDERVSKFLLDSDDTELIYDLRSTNGRIKNPEYDTFWNALEEFLEGQSVVNDRRQNLNSYLPVAISVEDLRKKVLSTLPEGTKAPSASWIRLNFQPMNPYSRSAMCYTGRYNVKYHVQRRILRSRHEDSKYCFNQFILMKEMAVRFRDWSTFQCLDDKAIVPVGEPKAPVSTGVRAKHGCLVVGGSMGAVALDHDFHICGVVPSVCFLVNIPESAKDSFYDGTVHVTVKDKIFQASSPVRHAAETGKIMRQSEDETPKPILFRYSDGGPDHNTTFKSVQVAAVCEFIDLDLDMMICVRTAPQQSYNNPAERIMSLLNLALQNVAYGRNSMTEHLENRMKSLSTIKAVRKEAGRNPVLKESLLSSMSETVNSIKDRFAALTWKEEGVRVHSAATDEEINMIMKKIHVIDETVDLSNLKNIRDYPKLEDFMERHCEFRHYTFQIKKCAEESRENCDYCSCHPPRVPEDILAHFLPDPMVDENGDYRGFTQLYGSMTSDMDRPSLLSKPRTSEVDKKRKAMLTGAKARAFITCCECGKRRVVYCHKKLSLRQQQALARVEEELLYSCGSALFPDGPNQEILVVREGLTCQSTIETQYYADVSQCFPVICFHCGDSEIVNDDIRITQSKEEWGIVRPMCYTCLNEGKQIVTRNALKVGKKSRK